MLGFVEDGIERFVEQPFYQRFGRVVAPGELALGTGCALQLELAGVDVHLGMELK